MVLKQTNKKKLKLTKWQFTFNIMCG